MIKIIDKYLAFPIIGDFLICGLAKLLSVGLCKWFHVCIIISKDTTLQSLLNELVSSSLGVSGFIVALFTIILTFRESAGRNRTADEQLTGFHRVLRGRIYKAIIEVFSKSFLWSVICFLFFSYLEIAWPNFDNQTAVDLVALGIIFLVMCMLRCFLILRKLVDIEIDQT